MPPRPAMDDDDEVEADMTPMIDVIFLLLVFFILTTKFIPEEKIISSLMPTDKGQSAASSPPIEEVVNANILIYPARLPKGLQPSEYDSNWHANPFAKVAQFKVNQIDQGVQVDIEAMRSKNLSPQMESAIDSVHGYINQHLTALEDPTNKDFRGKQPPVIIHCFSGMPWSMALIAYDAVRAYEDKYVDVSTWSQEDWANPDKSRDVTFAPPRLRAYRKWEMGYELSDIIHTN